MRDFFVVWSIFDHDFETSHTICRAVLPGVNQTVVEVQAKSLVPQVVKKHTGHGSFPRDVIQSEVEVSVRPLETWINELRATGQELPNVNMFDEDDNDAEDPE